MAYLDGELPVERAAAAAAHLQECRECQIVAAELKSVSESLATWEIEAKEPAINSELAAALDTRETQSECTSFGRTLGMGDTNPVPAVVPIRWRSAGRRHGRAVGHIPPDHPGNAVAPESAVNASGCCGVRPSEHNCCGSRV